ncbi:DUF1949 domain-containing protein [Nocardioides speluncae]|uniref:DUF1949 domain-containing protein n=1 Tax=Nocardioides speluncae TaxID=2670337 RepID=UPI0023E8F7F9|nr:DUF1949 domain-containing protein [Nocardioides speluncae]
MREYAVTVGHADAARLESELRGRGVSVLDVAYADQATLRLGVPEGDATRLAGLLAELTAGTAIAVPGDDRWIDQHP